MIWTGETEPVAPKLGLTGWLRFGFRAVVFISVTVVLVAMVILTYPVERRTGGRYISDKIVRMWGRAGRMCAGLKLEIIGEEMRHGGALVANHSSWLDIFTMHNAAHIHFVSKAEVADWPGIGFLAKVTGTIFIVRKSVEAKRQQQAMAARIRGGDKLCFFPEGTSSDGLRVLPFKSSLFSVFHRPELREAVWVQPVSVAYIAPSGQPENFYGWWGDMTFGRHLLTIFGLSRGGRVVVTYFAPLKAAAYDNRKLLSRDAESIVRTGLKKSLGSTYKE